MKQCPYTGCGTWIRTKIDAFKGHSPAIRRSRNIFILTKNCLKSRRFFVLFLSRQCCRLLLVPTLHHPRTHLAVAVLTIAVIPVIISWLHHTAVIIIAHHRRAVISCSITSGKERGIFSKLKSKHKNNYQNNSSYNPS